MQTVSALDEIFGKETGTGYLPAIRRMRYVLPRNQP
jgi:hypothetical protein